MLITTTGTVSHRSQSPFRNVVSFTSHYNPVRLIKAEETKGFFWFGLVFFFFQGHMASLKPWASDSKSMLLQTHPCCLLTWTSVKVKKVSLASFVSAYSKIFFFFCSIFCTFLPILQHIQTFSLPSLQPLTLKTRQQVRGGSRRGWSTKQGEP